MVHVSSSSIYIGSNDLINGHDLVLSTLEHCCGGTTHRSAVQSYPSRLSGETSVMRATMLGTMSYLLAGKAHSTLALPLEVSVEPSAWVFWPIGLG